MDLIGEFVCEKAGRDPETVSVVLGCSLRSARTMRELVAGEWVSMAAERVDDAWVPGYRAARVYQTIERFVRWLHARGYVHEWSRDHLLHEVEEARYAHFVHRERPEERGMERTIQPYERGRVLRRFAESLAHPVERDCAPQAIGVLVSHLDLQLGRGDALLFGAIDVDAFIEHVLAGSRAEELEADCTLFTILAAFYRWLADEGRLDRARAAQQAEKLSAAALGTQLALGRAGSGVA